jgi:transcriptional regulator with XRE-family HTH domain
MPQIALPVEVMPQEVMRERDLGGAIQLSLKAAGLEQKEVQASLHMDKAQFSRWLSGQEGIKWDKLSALMDLCGNDAPLLWMLHARGYALDSVRKVETELQRENRVLREKLAAAIALMKGEI